MLIDTHAHLDMRHFDADRGQVIRRAKEAKVEIITVGTELNSSWQAVALAQKYDLYAAVGFHPHEAKHFKDKAQKLEELATNIIIINSNKVIAIGEIGLDFFKSYSPKEAQLIAFKQQLLLAQKLKLPIIVHNRQAEDELLNILRNEVSGLTGVIHSFFGDLKLAEQFLKLGFYLGISGPITFTQNIRLQETVRNLPLERLLLETDCPYLTPVPHRGKRNEPAYVHYVAEKIAQLQGITIEEVAEQTTENARKLFNFR